MQNLLTVRQAADVLGISEANLYGRSKKGDIPSVKIPGIGIRFEREALESLVREFSTPRKAE